jgi:hypothetical protein
MAKTTGMKVSLSEVSQFVDLKKITGVDVGKDKKLMREIAQECIDYIKERTEKGLALGGQEKLKSPYSPDYAKSQAFNAAGKSKSKVNMRLSGDMLESIDIEEETNTGFKIAIVDEDQVPKAFNHQVGDTVPRRAFFGITAEELKTKILPKFKNDLIDIIEDEAKTQSQAIKLVEKLEFELEED